MRLINLMGDDEVCVCFFVEVLKINQPKISRHLAYLKRAGVVEARRDGKWIHYRIAEPPDPHAAKIFREVRAWLESDPAMQNDRARLARICCAPTFRCNCNGRQGPPVSWPNDPNVNQEGLNNGYRY